MRSAITQAEGPGPAWSLPAALLELEQAGDLQLLCEVISIFRQDTLTRLEHLQDAVSRRDYEDIRREAHALKGSAAQLGAGDLATLCREIEYRAQEGRNSQLSTAVEELRTEFDRIWPDMAARAVSR